jgi:hypothetical protein
VFLASGTNAFYGTLDLRVSVSPTQTLLGNRTITFGTNADGSAIVNDDRFGGYNLNIGSGILIHGQFDATRTGRR